jgi:hypothetical protein
MAAIRSAAGNVSNQWLQVAARRAFMKSSKACPYSRFACMYGNMAIPKVWVWGSASLRIAARGPMLLQIFMAISVLHGFDKSLC